VNIKPLIPSPLLLVLLLSSGLMRAQNSTSYLNDTGGTSYGVNIPVENGFINVSNGNLHLEFPLASTPQRGALQLSERLIYDSRIWGFYKYAQSSGYQWAPANAVVRPAATGDAAISDPSGGWRFVSGNEVGKITYGQTTGTSSVCPYPMTDQNRTTGSTPIIWTDPQGGSHPFTAAIASIEDDCAFPYNPSYTQSLTPGVATDGSGYVINDDGSGSPVVLDKSGTQVYPQIIDRYGNYWSSDSQGNLVDDVGRTPVITTISGNVTYFDVLSPKGPIQNNGTRVRYTVTKAPIAAATNFRSYDDTDIHDWHSTNYLTPVQSIALPDGSQYSFTYDGTGELTSITLPTGGTIHYTYANFVDSSNTENRWIASRILGSDPATTFAPRVTATCVNYSTGCVEQVALHRPSGDETVYELTLANGAWNTTTTTFAGGAGDGYRLASTINKNTYSNPCTGNSSCIGGNYLSQSLSSTILYPSGAAAQTLPVYKQTQSFFRFQGGDLSDVKEWDFMPLTSAVPPDPTSRASRETKYDYSGVRYKSYYRTRE